MASLYIMGSGATMNGGFPVWYGDMIGDWREEVTYETGTRDALVIFTTKAPTSHRLYSLAQSPLYRNDMTTKGYLQSRHTDYYLGDGMSTPPTPNATMLDFGNDAAPTVATPASASPGTVTGTMTSLSALGADDNGESGLTYTWSALGPGAVTYSTNGTNGTNAARSTVATFSAAGDYTFVATFRDASGQTITSRVDVTVEKTLTDVYLNTTRQFTAAGVDQFGGGSIDSNRLYTAPGTAGPATIEAISDSLSGTASVSVTDQVFSKTWWKLDENSGTAISDSSGNGHGGQRPQLGRRPHRQRLVLYIDGAMVGSADHTSAEALVIVGSDRRGTTFRVFELSRVIGVSPSTGEPTCRSRGARRCTWLQTRTGSGRRA